MTLRGKLVVIVGVALAVYGVLNFAVQQWVLLPRFTALEEESALADMRRCILAVQREAEYLNISCLDWAAWDDTYTFVQGRNPSYIQSNLSEAVFASRLMSLFYVIKYDGSVVWSRVWGLEDDPESPMYEVFPKGSWPADHPLLQMVMESGHAEGLMNTPAGPMYIAAQPIVTSLVGSPPNGVLVMGRFLDHEFADRLRERTGVPFTIRPAMGADVSLAEFRAIGSVEGESVYVRPVDEGQNLSVMATCCDFQNENTFLIGAKIPRTFFLKGQEALRYSLISLLLAGALIIVAVMGSAQVIVVRPLGALVRSLVAVRSSGDLHGRVAMTRGDELGILANEFNAMMARLETDNQSRLVSEEQLRSREEELSALFAAAPDAIVTFDRNGRVLSVNAACERTFRLAAADFRGRPVTSLIPGLPMPADSNPGITGTVPGYEHGDGQELTGLRGDGSEFPVHVRVSSVKTNELFFVAIIRDITTLNELHDAMAQSRHLAQIGEMSASVAHEIRNPLAGISSVLQVFRDDLPAGDPKREVLADVFGQVRRLDRAVHNLLNFARPWEPELQDCDLAALASAMVGDLGSKAGFESIRMEVRDETEGAAHAAADPYLMQQVLRNVFENAAQAIGGSGAVTCTVLRVNGSVEMRIRDTGDGLSAEARERVFEPFYTTRTRGTGLGLAVCRRIVMAHGGTIAVDNHSQGGAEVTVVLPIGNS